MDYLYIFLISISPLGEARAGIPFGVANGIPVMWAFIIGCSANLLVFPVFYKGISIMNSFLWKHRKYKKGAIYLSKKAKRKTKKSIAKYGALGLMVFVMIPLPITGAYIGTIAAHIFNINYKHALYAISAGVIISCLIISLALHYGGAYYKSFNGAAI